MSDLEKKVAGLDERVKYLEALMLSQTYLNARFLKHQAWVAQQKFVIAPDTGKVRIYRIPVGYKDEEGEVIPMEFLTPDGVKSLTTINVFVIEEPAEEKKP